jgi:hypothetical protein
MPSEGTRVLLIVAALILAAIAGIAALTKRHVELTDQRQTACERIGGVLVRQDRGGAVCVQRAAPPSAKGSKWT